MPVPLAGSARGVGQHRHLGVEQRHAHRRAEQRPVAVVVGVRHERHAGRQHLRPRGLDEHVPAAADAGESQTMEDAGAGAVLQFGLRHGGAERDVPQARGLGLVGLAASQVAQEGPLRHPPAALVDGGVGEAPVHRHPEAPVQVLERPLVGGGELQAQVDEVPPADRDRFGGIGGRFEVLVMGHRQVAAHAEEVLHPALGGQAIVVPTHRVEHLQPPHPLVAGHTVGLRVAEHVPDVQSPTNGWRRSVDGENLRPPPPTIEPVDPLRLPPGTPPRLQPLQSRPLGHPAGRSGALAHPVHATGAAQADDGWPRPSLRCRRVRRADRGGGVRDGSPVPEFRAVAASPGVLKGAWSELRRAPRRVEARGATLPPPCASCRCRGIRLAPPGTSCRE